MKNLSFCLKYCYKAGMNFLTSLWLKILSGRFHGKQKFSRSTRNFPRARKKLTMLYLKLEIFGNTLKSEGHREVEYFPKVTGGEVGLCRISKNYNSVLSC